MTKVTPKSSTRYLSDSKCTFYAQPAFITNHKYISIVINIQYGSYYSLLLKFCFHIIEQIQKKTVNTSEYLLSKTLTYYIRLVSAAAHSTSVNSQAQQPSRSFSIMSG